MVTIVVIGMTGEGKSEFVKKYIQNRNCCVMDLQNEYGPKTKYPNQVPLNLSDNTKDARCRYIGGDFDEFQKIVLQKKNTVCVFEEATIFLEGRTGKTMRRILTNKIFTQNVYILLFHSISAVPPRILQLTNYVVLYRTADELYQVERKYPSLLTAFNETRQQWEESRGKYKVIKIM